MVKYFSVLVLSLLMSLPSFAADGFTPGKDYEVLPVAVPTRDSKKVEVVEVFWYGCIHCFHFETLVEAWKVQQLEDVDFYSMPAMWNKPMISHAKAFYTAKALGDFDKMSHILFQTMNVKKNRLKNVAAIKAVFVVNGTDEKKFDATYNSFGVASQVKLAESRAKAYKVQGTPEIIVNGKYRVSSSMTGSQANMLKVVDFLVSKERAALVK